MELSTPKIDFVGGFSSLIFFVPPEGEPGGEREKRSAETRGKKGMKEKERRRKREMMMNINFDDATVSRRGKCREKRINGRGRKKKSKQVIITHPESFECFSHLGLIKTMKIGLVIIHTQTLDGDGLDKADLSRDGGKKKKGREMTKACSSGGKRLKEMKIKLEAFLMPLLGDPLFLPPPATDMA